MRTVSSATSAAWQAGDFTGPNRMMTRVTIQKNFGILTSVGDEVYSSFIFGSTFTPVELPNVRNVSWQRSIDQDVASCTITLYNTAPMPLGTVPERETEIDYPGFYCADPETEVLSQRGWLRYDELTTDDFIYTLNPISGLAEWNVVQEVFAKHLDGQMTAMEGRSVSALVTPNHRWAVTSKDHMEKSSGFLFKETRDLLRYDTIPLIRSGEENIGLHSADFAALIGWVVTDGTFQKPGNGIRVTINQSATANPAKCEEIRLLLKRIGHPFSERIQGEEVFFRFSGVLAAQVRSAAPNKRLTMDFVESLDREGQTALLSTLIGGDGGVVGTRTNYICTKDKEQAGIYAALAARCGFATNTHTRTIRATEIKGRKLAGCVMYYVNIKIGQNSRMENIKTETVDYSGIVWCPRTANGTFFARRNGHTYFTGNTYSRGITNYSSRWGFTPNGWHDFLVPDRIVRTYQGYGFDPSVIPELDTHLYQTGVWMIDDVEYDSNGLITLTCRDVGRVLVDEIMFPPVVPVKKYPLKFVATHSVANPDIVTTTDTSAWFRPSYSTDSGVPYVGVNGSVLGHHGGDAFDSSDTSYWLSIGNASPNAGYSFEYIEGSFSPRTISGVRFHAWGGPYTVYISVRTGGGWDGKQLVPYDENNPASAPNGADIKFVYKTTVSKGGTATFKFPKPILNAQAVRLTFTDLFNSGLGAYPYRAGVYKVEVAQGNTLTTTASGGTHTEGNYSDYLDIVKRLLAYGGFYWPIDATNAITTLSDGSQVVTLPAISDAVLEVGRVWGDFELTGTKGVVDLGVDIWDKKPLIDGINYVREIVGFLFFVDEQGGAVFRSPNIWHIGNYLSSAGANAGRTTDIIEIDEETTLIGLRAKLTSRDVRERIFIANVAGGKKFGAVARGYNPYPSGLRRVTGWCVDTETQIFTRRGWLTYDQVRVGDETLSLDMAGVSHWQPIKEVAIFEDEEREVIEFKSNNFSAVTTPDHRWLIERLNSYTKVRTNRYATSETLTTMDRIPRARILNDLPVEATIDDAMVELVAWTYTESSIRRVGNYRGINIYQSPTVNPDNCERIRRSLEKTFGDGGWSEAMHKGTIVYALSSESSRKITPYLVDDDTKTPTMEFLTALTKEQLELFIEVSLLGDGNKYGRITSPFGKKKVRQFYQNVGPRLDAFLAACALLGVATSYHVRSGKGNWHGNKDVATVTLLHEPYYNPAQTNAKRERRTENITVWCPAMPTHHNWLARRNGSVYYTGNTDQNFKSVKECQTMADLIAIRQAFAYRTDSITINGNPAIQIDDQVRIFERTTNEGYLHYVKGITSQWDLETGQWTYTLDTNWLGDDPTGTWAFTTDGLSQDTIDYLTALGKIV